jgi:hypothetical protein
MRPVPELLLPLALAACTADAPSTTPPPNEIPAAAASPDTRAHAEARLAERLASASRDGRFDRAIDPSGARSIAAAMARLGEVRRAMHRGEVDRAALEEQQRQADAECLRVAGETCNALLFTPRRSR